jgi:hypothetical protein
MVNVGRNPINKMIVVAETHTTVELLLCIHELVHLPIIILMFHSCLIDRRILSYNEWDFCLTICHGFLEVVNIVKETETLIEIHAGCCIVRLPVLGMRSMQGVVLLGGQQC